MNYNSKVTMNKIKEKFSLSHNHFTNFFNNIHFVLIIKLKYLHEIRLKQARTHANNAYIPSARFAKGSWTGNLQQKQLELLE